MTERINRVYNAINGTAGDRFPKGELVITNGFARDFLSRLDLETDPASLTAEDALLACCRHLNTDLVCLQAGDLLKKYNYPEEIAAYIRGIVDSGFFVFWIVNGAYQTAVTRTGFYEFNLECVENPEAVFKKMSDISVEAVREIEMGVKAGVHGIILADDIAYAQSTYFSVSFAKKYVMPFWQKQVETARRLKTSIFFHSDGNINSMLPLITAAGFDGLQCIEPAAGMEIGKIRSLYGKDLCLMGNIDPRLLMDKHEIRSCPADLSLSSAVKKLLGQAAPGASGASGSYAGRFIFGTCSGLYEGMSPERVLSMYRLADASGGNTA